VALPMMVHPDEATAIERGTKGAKFFAYSLAHYYVFGEHHPGRTSIWDEYVARGGESVFPTALTGAIGTPAQVRDVIARYEAAGVDQLIFVMQAGNNRHEHICEALELFGAEVLPEFAARADENDRAVDERLADAIAAALARRKPARSSDPAYTIAPTASGPAHAGNQVHARGENGRPGLAVRAQAAGDRAFRRFVRGSNDRRLERVVGSWPGLGVLFAGMVQRFEPEKAAGFEGELQYDLRLTSGRVRTWTVEVRGDRARAHPGAATDPKVTLRVGLADFLRIATRELDPGKALLDGRLEVAGDFEVMARLGEMFGEPSRF